jgi:hypothetical protein
MKAFPRISLLAAFVSMIAADGIVGKLFVGQLYAMEHPLEGRPATPNEQQTLTDILTTLVPDRITNRHRITNVANGGRDTLATHFLGRHAFVDGRAVRNNDDYPTLVNVRENTPAAAADVIEQMRAIALGQLTRNTMININPVHKQGKKC